MDKQGKKIREFKTSNGLEFLNEEFKWDCKDECVSHTLYTVKDLQLRFVRMRPLTT